MSLAVIVLLVRAEAARVQVGRLLAAGASGTALLGIAAYSVKRFPAPAGDGPEDPRARLLVGIVAVALVVGLAHGLVLRAGAAGSTPVPGRSMRCRRRDRVSGGP